jgi:hypothetical protein
MSSEEIRNQPALLRELERASDRGLTREYPDYEGFARDVLSMMGQPDTPVNRAKLQVGEPGNLIPLMAGPERAYFVAFFPASPERPAGETFMIERPESNARIMVIVVTPDVESQLAALPPPGTGI